MNAKERIALPVQRLQVWLYISNVALLLAHEIDSAYWHEWELFHLPGGIQGFVLLLPLSIAQLSLVLFWSVRRIANG